MKKLVFGLAAAMCVLALSAPVFADIKVGGMVASDAYWWERSEERMINLGAGPNSWDTTRFAMPQAWNRLWVDYKSDDKKIAGYIQLRSGGIKGNSAASGTPGTAAPMDTFGENAFTWEYGWIDWHINPSLYFRMGRQTQTFSIYTPDQNMGHADGHIIGAGFGNIHGGTSRDGFRAYIKFSDMVRMEIELLDPNTEPINAQEPVVPLGARESNAIPRIDLSLPIKIANFSVEPSVTWLRQKFDNVPVGDDSFDIWGAALGVKAGFGPFTVSGEVTYGQNLGAGNYVGGNAQPARLADNSIEDAKELAAWIQLEFNFGDFAIQGVVGRDKTTRDNIAGGDDFSVAQWMYGINFPIKIAKNFTITPNVFYYDYDDGATVNSIENIDRGTETLVGVQFLLTF